MRTIAFVTQKGGSGRSTLASSLAVAALEQGERVCLVDMDPQATLMTWSKTRGARRRASARGGPDGFTTLLDGLEKKGVSLVVIDTPGAEERRPLAAMKAADLNVIPSRPSVFDLWASAQTRAALKETRSDYVFLLNQCPPAQQSARVDEGVATLEAMGGLISPLVLAASTTRRPPVTAGASRRSIRRAAAQEMRTLVFAEAAVRAGQGEVRGARKAA